MPNAQLSFVYFKKISEQRQAGTMGSVDGLSYAPLSCHVMSCSAMPCKQHATTAKSIYSVASAAQRKLSCHNNAYIQCCRCCHAHTVRCQCKVYTHYAAGAAMHTPYTACCRCRASLRHVTGAYPEVASAKQSMAENSASSSVTNSSKVAVEGSIMRTEPS